VSPANLLSTVRLVLTAPIIALLYADGRTAGWWALALFLFAMLTDVFDGRLARRQPDRSPLGNYLDPVADKVLLLSLFICLAAEGVVPAWMVAVLAAREFVVNGVRAAGAVQGRVVGANWMGKTKTLLQTVAVSCALLGLALGGESRWADYFLDAAWWVTLVVAVLAAAFAGVFIYWNRSLFQRRPA
jgi:CDP-diacylglycerol--glycerol-3-phosphate 3-phosphatidyltransferase